MALNLVWGGCDGAPEAGRSRGSTEGLGGRGEEDDGWAANPRAQKNFVAWAGSGWVAALQGLDRQRPGTNAGLRLRGTCVMTQGRHREAPVGRAQIVDFQNSWPSHDAREHSTASKGAMGGTAFVPPNTPAHAL